MQKIVWLSRDKNTNSNVVLRSSEPKYCIENRRFYGDGWLCSFCKTDFRELTGIELVPGDLFKCEMIQKKKGFELKVIEKWEYS